MPNDRSRYKKTGAQTRKSGKPRYGKPRALTDLLARPSSSVLSGLSRNAQAARDWLALVQASLPADLSPRVTSAVTRGPVLTIYVESAVWAARLQFAADEVLARARETDPALRTVRVKVLPAAPRAKR